MKKYLLKRRWKIKHQIRLTSQKFYEDLYNLLNELLEIERKINPKYTLRQLAIDNTLNEQFVYQILGWRKASIYVKQQVKEEKISLRKATRLLRKVGDLRQDEAAKDIIKYKMTDREMDLYVKKFSTDKQRLLDERKYNNEWNISRDILYYCQKFNRSLLAVKSIKKNKITDSLKLLKTHKRLLVNAIRILELRR